MSQSLRTITNRAERMRVRRMRVALHCGQQIGDNYANMMLQAVKESNSRLLNR